MCNTFTKLDNVNREKGHHFREAFKPYPPREPDGSLESIAKRHVAQEHDAMTENVLLSFIKDRKEGYTYDFCLENPRGACPQSSQQPFHHLGAAQHCYLLFV